MIEVIDLQKEHLDAALKILMDNYSEEKQAVSILPDSPYTPNLSYMIEHGFGVAAIEQEKLVGYMICFNPWKECFATHATGTFIPLHGHGAIKQNRQRIYQKMYTALGAKLVEQGARYHAIACFAHDTDAINTFFDLGFGKRCMDRIRKAEPLSDVKAPEGFTFEELPLKDFNKIRQLRRDLDTHLTKSPSFMVSVEEEREAWLDTVEKGDRRTFVAKKGQQICAYLDIKDEGENFVTNRTDMKDIHGAWCIPEYRGTGLYDSLLNYVLGVVAKEGAVYLGVDHETFNLTAMNYWKKHFEGYTVSLVRRIDECFLD